MTTTMANEPRSGLTLSPRDRVAVVAGSGSLPAEVVDALVREGHRPLLVAVEGEADRLEGLGAHDRMTVTAEELGSLVSRLRRERVTHLVLAGGMARRPPLRKVRPSLGLVRILPRLMAAYARGDDGLLRAIIAHIESSGIRVVGAHALVPDLLAREGPLTRARATSADRRDLAAARAAAHAIGALDIGQAAVAIGGRAIALEGIEGTDGLLERAKNLRSHGRIAGKARGVLVKCAKPDQEMRADLPSIGPATVDAAHAAGLAGIGVEAGRSLVLDHATTVARADALGLFVVGLPGGEPQ